MSRSSWCYVTWYSLACQDHLDATSLDLLLHVKIILMLRHLIFTCMPRSSWCYVTWSSLACQDHLDATSLDLLLHVKIILMLRHLIFTCMSRSSWCYATWSSLVCQDHFDATPLDLHLHVKIILMLRDGRGLFFILYCFEMFDGGCFFLWPWVYCLAGAAGLLLRTGLKGPGGKSVWCDVVVCWMSELYTCICR